MNVKTREFASFQLFREVQIGGNETQVRDVIMAITPPVS
jgi:hypothetical protein